jgi:hypothetical protein
VKVKKYTSPQAVCWCSGVGAVNYALTSLRFDLSRLWSECFYQSALRRLTLWSDYYAHVEPLALKMKTIFGEGNIWIAVIFLAGKYLFYLIFM